MLLLVVGLLARGPVTAATPAEECRELKKDIDEMQADLNEYAAQRHLSKQDIAELQQEAVDIRKDMDEYVADTTSDADEVKKAREGLQLVARMEEGLREGRKGMVLNHYGKLIEVYRWFYADEDCQ
jgi:uncharacterized coiled-coil DUF342 family protein